MAALDESKNVSKHGECVCLLKEVKHEVERVKSKSNVSLNNRQLVNVIILAFIKEHNDGYNHLASLCRLAKFYIGYLILYKSF